MIPGVASGSAAIGRRIPSITTGASHDVPEGDVAVVVLAATIPVTWSLVGGADIGDFVVDADTGELEFDAPKSFASPADADVNNVYLVRVRATAVTGGLYDELSLSVTVLNEWTTVFDATTGAAGDTNVGGTNTRLFINATSTTGEGTGETRVTLTASSTNDLVVDNAAIGVALTAPSPLINYSGSPVPLLFSGSPSVTIPAGTSLTSDAAIFAFGGSDHLLVAINHAAASQLSGRAETGASLFGKTMVGDDTTNTAVTSGAGQYGFLGPSGDTAYGVSLIETKPGTADTTAPSITSSATASVSEDVVLSYVPTADKPVTWSLAGGADSGKFEISTAAVPHVVRFTSNAVKDFEAPDDADVDNDYVMVLRATDSWGNTDDLTLTVSVTDSGAGVWVAATGTPEEVSSNNGGWNGINLRQFYAATVISKSGSGGKVRLTLKAASSEGAQVAGMYIGHGATSGDEYDFDGTQVAVTVGGSPTFTIAANTPTVTDEITYAVDETKSLVVSAYFNNAAADAIMISQTSGNSKRYSKTAADESGTTDVTGYASAGSSTHGFVHKVEVLRT